MMNECEQTKAAADFFFILLHSVCVCVWVCASIECFALPLIPYQITIYLRLELMTVWLRTQRVCLRTQNYSKCAIWPLISVQKTRSHRDANPKSISPKRPECSHRLFRQRATLFKMLLSVDTIEWMEEQQQQQQFDNNESKGNSPEQRKGESQNRKIASSNTRLICVCMSHRLRSTKSFVEFSSWMFHTIRMLWNDGVYEQVRWDAIWDIFEDSNSSRIGVDARIYFRVRLSVWHSLWVCLRQATHKLFFQID